MPNPYPKITIAALTLCTALAMAFGEPQGQDEALGSAPARSDSSFFVDPRDGKRYRTVRIGGQVWMAYNLNYKTGKSWCYGDNNSNCKKYGRLYDWNTAKSACPDGWHLPTSAEWHNLMTAIGEARGRGRTSSYDGSDSLFSYSNAGKKLKSKRGWSRCIIVYDSPAYTTCVTNANGTDDYGFSALPSGVDLRFSAPSSSDYYSKGYYGERWSAAELKDGVDFADGEGTWWSATVHERGFSPYGDRYAVVIVIRYSRDYAKEDYHSQQDAASVRCVMD